MQYQKQIDQLWQLFLQLTYVDNIQLQRTIKNCHRFPIAANQQINTMANTYIMFQMNHRTESTRKHTFQNCCMQYKSRELKPSRRSPDARSPLYWSHHVKGKREWSAHRINEGAGAGEATRSQEKRPATAGALDPINADRNRWFLPSGIFGVSIGLVASIDLVSQGRNDFFSLYSLFINSTATSAKQ